MTGNKKDKKIVEKEHTKINTEVEPIEIDVADESHLLKNSEKKDKSK